MALKAIIVKIDDVDEKYRDLYVQKGDKFVLQVEGIKTDADVLLINNALIKERADHKKAADSLKEANTKLAEFGEVTPEQVVSLTEKIANFEAAGTPELTKNFEKIVTDRVAAVLDGKLKVETAKLNKTIAEQQTALVAATQQVEKFTLNDQHRTIDDAVRAAATKAKVLPGAEADALMRARAAFQLQEGKVITADGQTPEDWIEARKADAGHWWPVSRGAGAHGSDGNGNFNASDNPWAPGNWNVTKQGQLVMSDPAKAGRMAEAAGSKIGATAPTPVAK